MLNAQGADHVKKENHEDGGIRIQDFGVFLGPAVYWPLG